MQKKKTKKKKKKKKKKTVWNKVFEILGHLLYFSMKTCCGYLLEAPKNYHFFFSEKIRLDISCLSSLIEYLLPKV